MDPELTELLSRIAELSDDELADLEASLTAAFDEIDAERPTADAVALMGEISAALTTVREASAERETEAERLAAEAAALRAQVHSETPPDDGEGEGDGEGEETTTEETTTEETTTETAPEAIAAQAEGTEATAAETETPEAVAAAGAPAARPSIANIAARRPAARAPRRAGEASLVPLVATSSVPGIVRAGEAIRDMDGLSHALWAGMRQIRAGSTGSVTVASAIASYPEERRLSMENPALSYRRMEQVTSPDAVVAAGGLCAPVEVRYDVVNISDAESRPATTAAARFQSDRGGVRFIPPPRLGDYTAGVDQWTAANDANPTDPTTKPCVTVDCDDAVEVLNYAVTACLQVGNFFARTYDERLRVITDLLRAEHARLAEELLLARYGALSTIVTAGENLGATRDTLADLDRALAAFRYRHRMRSGVAMRLMLPRWFRDMVRADLAREAPGSADERLATADAKIDTFFAVRNINTTWLMEGEDSTQRFGAQPAAALLGWPTRVYGYLFHEGAFSYLDGGELNIGAFRDGDLVATNDYKVFMESFENLAFTGVESLRISFDVCPSGEAAALVDFVGCTTGS